MRQRIDTKLSHISTILDIWIHKPLSKVFPPWRRRPGCRSSACWSRQGEPGLPAGEIAEAVAGRQNTISTHLAILARAGLIRGERDGRVIRYSADFAAARGLIGFLLEDCCDGRPEICVPLLGTLDCLNQPARKAGQGGNCDVC